MTKLANFDQLGSYQPLHPQSRFAFTLAAYISVSLYHPLLCITLILFLSLCLSWLSQLAVCLMRAAFTLTDRRSLLISRYVAHCGLAAD